MDTATVLLILGKRLELPLSAHIFAIVHPASENYLVLGAFLECPFYLPQALHGFIVAQESHRLTNSCTAIT